MLSNSGILTKRIEDLATQAVQTLGTKKDNLYILNQSKLTPEFLSALGKKLSGDIDRTIIAHNIVQESLEKLKPEINDVRANKVKEDITPGLEKLGLEYLRYHKDDIITELTELLSGKNTPRGNITNQFIIPKEARKNIANNILTTHLKKSEDWNKIQSAAIQEAMRSSQETIARLQAELEASKASSAANQAALAESARGKVSKEAS